MNKKLSLLLLIVLLSSILVLQSKNIIYGQEQEKLDESEERITISIIGDILLDGSVRYQINKNGINYPWNNVKEHLIQDDITIGNLETSITTGGKLWPDKQFNFRSDPINLKAMKEAGIDILSLANNHTLDYGYEGLVHTLTNLEDYQIKGVGAGRNKLEAIKGIIVEEKGLKIGILGFSRVVPDVKWYATNKRPGLVGAYNPHIREVTNRIREMKKEVDFLVLSIHWGKELSNTPRKEEMDLAKELIDAGADIIMGHHPHVLQGIELYKGKPIFYSLGNFVFSSKNKLTSNTIIGQINIVNKKIDNIKLIPCTIVNGRPTPDKNIESKIKYLNTISKKFKTNIDNNGTIKIKEI